MRADLPEHKPVIGWTPRAGREFLGAWRENGNAPKARAHLAAALDEIDRLRDEMNRRSRFRFTQPDARAVRVAFESLEYDVMNNDNPTETDEWAIRRLRDLLVRYDRSVDA